MTDARLADIRTASTRILAWWFGHPGTPVHTDPHDLYVVAAFARDAAARVEALEAKVERLLAVNPPAALVSHT